MKTVCPVNIRCDGGCAWTCPHCGDEVYHRQFCTRCLFGWCRTCLGSGIVEDPDYTWASPRKTRCPECSPEPRL